MNVQQANTDVRGSSVYTAPAFLRSHHALLGGSVHGTAASWELPLSNQIQMFWSFLKQSQGTNVFWFVCNALRVRSVDGGWKRWILTDRSLVATTLSVLKRTWQRYHNKEKPVFSETERHKNVQFQQHQTAACVIWMLCENH